MKNLSKKALTGIIAVGLTTVIGSVSAFAATTFPGYSYNLSAGQKSGSLSYLADDNYMYFDTRPTAGAGGVYLTVMGSGGTLGEAHFPFQVDRSPLQIQTTIGSPYTMYLTAGSTEARGVLSVWTSEN